MQDGNVVTQILLPVSLAIIMLSVGLELTIADFKRVAVQPKDFFIGAFSQVVLLPAVAFALVSVWSMDPALAVGVMILAACPGGVTSNLMTYLARGDTALSVSLTAVISLLSVLTLPFIVAFSVAHFMEGARAPEISVGRMIVGVFAITTVPVAIGMTIKRFAPRFAAHFERTARIVSSILFVLVIAGAVYSERENIVDYFRQAGPATLMLNLIMMAIAYSLAKAARLGSRQQIAITLECGLQNGTLAIFVAVTLIGNTTMMVPGGIYSLLMFATAGAYMFLTRRGGAAAPARTG